MISIWMAYAAAVALLLGLAALAAETAARGRSLPTRAAWALSVAGSVVIPLWGWLRPAPPAPAPGAGGAIDAAALAFLLEWHAAVAAAPPTLLESLDAFVPVAWAITSALLALAVAAGFARIFLRARSWTEASVPGGQVLLSDDFGPALLGLRRPAVVLPRWALGLSADRVRWIVLHEEEHRRGGDALLLLAGALALVAMPWSPALWWQVRRLRAAVEVDCDARVLRHGVPAAAYGRMLLELGTRTGGPALPVAALSRPRSLLERRLTMIVHGVKRGRRGRTALAVAAAAALTVVACEAPAPTAVEPAGGGETEAALQVTPAAAKANAFFGQVLEADQAPIVYLDGVRLDGLPGDLDPDRIDRVEVVKGGAALATFGDEAAHGVVQIFTKEGTGDVPEGAMTVRLRGTASFGPAREEELRAQRRLKLTAAAERMGAEVRVIVDGEPYEGELRALDPDQVARVEIVGSAAEGGQRVHITTKKGGGGR